MGKSGNITFVTFFPGCTNIHLAKDVGSIPFILHRDYGYDSSLICYRNGDYPYGETEVPGLNIIFMKKGWYHVFKDTVRVLPFSRLLLRIMESACTAMDALPLLLRHGRNIEILQMYHLKDESVIIGLIYKLINPRGLLYLKLDLHPNIMSVCENDPGALERKPPLLYRAAKFDIITVESRQLYEFIRTRHRYFRDNARNLHYMPNGIDVCSLPQHIPDLSGRENIILHAGRLGNFHKRTELVLDTFAKVARDFPDWKLVLVGDMEAQFFPKLKAFLHEHDDIKDRIVYAGFLDTRKELLDHYSISKIFFFPSLPESFGLVVLEAASMGVALLGSDIPSMRDMTCEGYLGYLCPTDNLACYERSLRYMMSNEDELREKTTALTEFTRETFDWVIICGSLHGLIVAKLSRRKADRVEG